MIVEYSAQALADLSSIAAYLNARNPRAAVRVAGAVRRVIDDLPAQPLHGRKQDQEGVRKIIEPKFKYNIYYHVDPNRDVITVLTIRHHAQSRPFGDA